MCLYDDFTLCCVSSFCDASSLIPEAPTRPAGGTSDVLASEPADSRAFRRADLPTRNPRVLFFFFFCIAALDSRILALWDLIRL